MGMKRIEAGDPEARSLDKVQENVRKLGELFPELVTEGPDGFVVNLDVLRELVGERTSTEPTERYGLNWHDKHKARRLALEPSAGTLRPCPEESVDWDTTQNLMIEGDNLEVLKLLQKSYAGKVKLIYIDPPYNTGHDFVYPDDYRDNMRNYLEQTSQTEGGRKLTSNTEASGRFHTNWLNMMYPRLKVARDLLQEEGLIFVSCNSIELTSLVVLLNELFGEENLIAQLVWKKSYGGGSKSKHVVINHDYILCYTRAKELIDRIELPPDPAARRYYKFTDENVSTRGPYRLQPLNTNSNDDRSNLRYPIPYKDRQVWPEKQWQWEQSRTLQALARGELVFGERDGSITVNYKQYLFDEDGVERGSKPFSVLDGPYTQEGTADIESLFGDAKIFPFPKPVELIRHLLRHLHPSNDFLALDFFAGSGSTGEAVFRENARDSGVRKFILVQLPRAISSSTPSESPAAKFCEANSLPANIATITKERLRRAGKKIRDDNPLFHGDTGFRVFKLDSSNLREWDPHPADLELSLLDSIEHIKPGRSELDVLYELLLKLGLDLCVPIETRTLAGKEVHAVGGGVLLTCLAPEIRTDDVEALALGLVDWHRELAPAGATTCVFRDSAFEDDVAKTNLAMILHQHGLAHVRSL
jgi:adenine-specific DNA-methyltransferase